MANNYRSKIATDLLGKDGDFPAYFKLYEGLFELGTGDHIIQIEHTVQQNRNPISHDTILAAAKMVRENTSLTLDAMKVALEDGLLQQGYSSRELEFVLKIAVRAMYMIDSNVKGSHGPEYTIGVYRHAPWLSEESFVDFITKCFPHVTAERKSRVATVLENKKSLKAWKLRDRLGIVFRGTDNLVDHLLFDPVNRILYLFHHAAYLKAHLDRCSTHLGGAAKDAGIASAIEK